MPARQRVLSEPPYQRSPVVSSRLPTWLPAGGLLDPEAWRERHRWVLRLLWAEAALVGVASLIVGDGLARSVFETALVGIFAVGATAGQRFQRLSGILAALGLLTASAVLVHLFSGTIELHFSYFVIVGVITLYQDWAPLLIAIVYVVVQHGVGGVIDPSTMYGPAASHHPWMLAGVHGAFIAATAVVGMASWRMNERLQLRAIERWSQLAEAQKVARLGSWEADVQRGTFEGSDELFRLFDLDPTSDHGSVHAFVSRVLDDDRAAVQAANDTALASGLAATGDFRLDTASDGLQWVHGRIEALRSTDGHVAFLAGTVLDITARKAAEAEQANTLSQLSATLDATAEGILVMSSTGHLTNLNTSFAEMFGLDPDRSVPFATDDVLTAVLSQLADPAAMLRWIERVDADPNSRSHGTAELLDGRILEVSYMPQTIAGVTVGRAWSVRDLTERVLLERAPAESVRFNDAVREASPGITTITALDTGAIDWSSRSIWDTFGWVTPTDLRGSDQFDPSVALVDRPRVESANNAVTELPDGGVSTVRYRVRQGDDERWVSRRTTPFARAVDGSVSKGLSVLGDVTDVVAAEIQLREAAEAQQAFTASVSHELRTPTTSIIGYAEELLDLEHLAAEAREFVGIVHRNGLRLNQLIDDLLTLSTAEMGYKEMHLAPTDIEPLINDLTSSFRAAAQRSDIGMIVHHDPSRPLVLADARRLEQVLANLISNALKFTPPGGSVRITSTTTPAAHRHRKGRSVLIEVTDTGIGIPPADMDKVFNRFYRAQSARDEGIPGTGLGLSIAKTMIEAQGGSLTLRSTPHEGTAVTIIIPASNARTNAAAPGASSLSLADALHDPSNPVS